ncbi:MAG: acyl-CoA dehydrogenase family protein [Candidatus Paceibacterota bacterium]
MSKLVEIRREDNFATVIINNPPYNTLNDEVFGQLTFAINELAEDFGVESIIITGKGHFSAGADVNRIWDIAQSGDEKLGRELLARANAVIYSILKCKKPVLAAINGYCLGGGNEIAMACDYRIATIEAQLGQPEISLGIMPGMGGTQVLPFLVEPMIALKMLIGGNPITAAKARDIGLVDEEVADSGSMVRFVKDLARNPQALPRKTHPFVLAVSYDFQQKLDENLELKAFVEARSKEFPDAVGAIVKLVQQGLETHGWEVRLVNEQNAFMRVVTSESAKRGLAKSPLIKKKIEPEKPKEISTTVAVPPWESDDIQLLRQTVREFAKNEIQPRVAWMEENKEVPKDMIGKMAELGLFGTSFPEKYGGMDFGHVGLSVVADELGYVHLSTLLTFGAHVSLACEFINLFGSEDQKQRYLVPGIQGKLIGALATTEPGVGSDVGAMKTKAKKVDGGWIINGAKQFITNAKIADFIIIIAQTDSMGGNKALAAFVINTADKGFSIVKTEKKMGLHASCTSNFAMDDMFVPDNNLVGDVGQGFKMVMRTFNNSRIMLSASTIGVVRRAMDESIAFAKDRPLFGEPMWMKQNTQFKLAEMETIKYMIECMVYDAAWKIDRGLDVRNEAAMVKYMATEHAFKAVDTAVQLHGGSGFMSEYPVEMFFRDIRVWRLFEGTSEVQLLTIAKELIKTRFMG